MSDAFAPLGETAHDLWMERSRLNGVILAGVAYGILFSITLQTFLLLLRSGNSRSPRPLITFLSVIFTLATVGFGANIKFNQMTYIDDRNTPGGPNAFAAQNSQHWLNILCFTSYTIMSWIADVLVVRLSYSKISGFTYLRDILQLWRFTIIWNYNYWMVVFPVIVYLGSIGSSLALIIIMARPNAGLWIPEVVKLGISYWSLSISLNVILTLLIVGRIMYARSTIKSTLGDDHSSPYTSIAAMLIESSALYSIWGLVFLVCYARNTPFQNIVFNPLGQVQGIAPVLILLRVAQGRAWSRDTAITAQINFAGPGEDITTNSIPLRDSMTSASRNPTRELTENIWENAGQKKESAV